MTKVCTFLLHQTPFFMIRKIGMAATILLLSLQATVYAQTEPGFAQAFGVAMSRGDLNSLGAMLDEEVELMQPGSNGTFQRQVVKGKIADFLRQNPPAKFLMKHQGASADGQVYAIGQLTTQSGSSYKVLLRAKPEGAHYRIFKLDLQNL